MADWLTNAIEQAKNLFPEGDWINLSAIPKDMDINKVDILVFNSAPPKGFIIINNFYKKVVAIDQRMNVLETFSMELDVMGSYAESYGSGQAGLPQQDPFEGI